MYCGQNFKSENFRLSFGKVYVKVCVAQSYFFLIQAILICGIISFLLLSSIHKLSMIIVIIAMQMLVFRCKWLILRKSIVLKIKCVELIFMVCCIIQSYYTKDEEEGRPTEVSSFISGLLEEKPHKCMIIILNNITVACLSKCIAFISLIYTLIFHHFTICSFRENILVKQ